MSQEDQIAAALNQIRQTSQSEAADIDAVICYVPGTLVSEPKGELVNGNTISVLQIHPDGTPAETRKWVRSHGPLATWVLASGALNTGVRIIAVGHPAPAPGNSRSGDAKPWMLEADRITVDLWDQTQ